MPEWLQNSNYAAAFLWVIGALVLLIVVLILIRLIRGMTFGTFVSGGRNRKTRLAVMDATAVDSHRRLILVRRDDVEHLILIGGPTDVVVEQNIRLNQPRRPVLATDHRQEPAQQAQPAQPAQQAQPLQPPQRPVEQHRTPPPQAAAPASAPLTSYEQKPVEPRRLKPLPTFQSLRATLWPDQTERQPPATGTVAPPSPTAPPAHDAFRQRETPAPALRRDDTGLDFASKRSGDPAATQNGLPRSAAREQRSIEEEMNRILGDLTSKF